MAYLAFRTCPTAEPRASIRSFLILGYRFGSRPISLSSISSPFPVRQAISDKIFTFTQPAIPLLQPHQATETILPQFQAPPEPEVPKGGLTG